MRELSATLTSAVEPDLLADVYAEGLDEAEFYCELLDAAFDDAEHTLDSLAHGPERALLAMLDLLVVDASVDRNELAAGLQAGPRRRQAATMALLQLGERELVAQATRDPDPVLRLSAIRGASLLRESSLIEHALQTLDGERGRSEALPALELCAAYRVCPASVAHWLQQDEPELLCVALRAARWGRASFHRKLVEELLRYPSEAVHEEAIVTGLICQSPTAYGALRTRALNAAPASPLAMQLFAALGGPFEFRELEGLLSSASLRKDVLFALGFSGDITVAFRLLPYLDDTDTRAAKLAFEAIASIAGIDTGDEAFGRTLPLQPPGDLPAVAEDAEALAALATPEDGQECELHEAVDDLGLPDATQVARWLTSLTTELSSNTRYLGGMHFGPEAIASYLASAPLRRRHALALSLQIRSAGQHCVDTRAMTRVQRAQLDGLASLQRAQLSNPFLAY